MTRCGRYTARKQKEDSSSKHCSSRKSQRNVKQRTAKAACRLPPSSQLPAVGLLCAWNKCCVRDQASPNERLPPGIASREPCPAATATTHLVQRLRQQADVVLPMHQEVDQRAQLPLEPLRLRRGQVPEAELVAAAGAQQPGQPVEELDLGQGAVVQGRVGPGRPPGADARGEGGGVARVRTPAQAQLRAARTGGGGAVAQGRMREG